MNTPICDFVAEYCRSGALRLHMPGHKGKGPLGFEELDLTEMDGADDLYHPCGIIGESEANASRLFGCPTLYSTEGSSQCIRAMVMLITQYAKSVGKAPRIAAFRNVHKTFLSAAALTDAQVVWLCPKKPDSYLSCLLTARELEESLDAMVEKPAAVYLTSPDYLGNVADIRSIAEVCHSRSILLAVDNAHGAYLRFLAESAHPMDLGADLCCDSAHKTLPVITGGAYLHISPAAPDFFHEQAREALAMFGSTSPSYLILQSLDAANRYLAEGYREALAGFIARVEETRGVLTDLGYTFCGQEPIKFTLATKPYGYEGTVFAELLKAQGLYCEFADPDFVVLMVTPETGSEGLARLEQVMSAIPARAPLCHRPPEFHLPESAMSIREAAFAVSETIPAPESLGRILARASVGCPPAVPIVSCGEVIDEYALKCFSYYGIKSCTVVKS